MTYIAITILIVWAIFASMFVYDRAIEIVRGESYSVMSDLDVEEWEIGE